ncbi:MAG: GNAT family N-acetyltransferase [Clostridiales bacterium]|jgi:ribosomal-protein-alanine N-acetyltransferase|nr:GNAT family N-acetyltransferase [Clostridiales bacterium]
MENLYRTDRLVLKAADLSDATLIHDYFVRNREFLEKFEPARDEGFYSLKFCRDLVEYDRYCMENKQAVKFWIFKGNRVIGSVALNNIIWGVFLSAFVGYRLDKDEVNKGFMTEALKKLISISFDTLMLHRLEANIMPRNRPSLMAARKAGFVYEGLSKKYLKINNVWEDHIHMVILNNKLK